MKLTSHKNYMQNKSNGVVLFNDNLVNKILYFNKTLVFSYSLERI